MHDQNASIDLCSPRAPCSICRFSGGSTWCDRHHPVHRIACSLGSRTSKRNAEKSSAHPLRSASGDLRDLRRGRNPAGILPGEEFFQQVAISTARQQQPPPFPQRILMGRVTPNWCSAINASACFFPQPRASRSARHSTPLPCTKRSAASVSKRCNRRFAALVGPVHRLLWGHPPARQIVAHRPHAHILTPVFSED